MKGSVELDGRGDDIEVADVSDTVTVHGEFSGALQFRNVGQTLRFESLRTDMTAQKLSGRLDMEVGSLEVNGIDGPFEITTRQKDITVNDFKHSVHITDSNGQITLANLHAAHPRYPGGIEKRRRRTDPSRQLEFSNRSLLAPRRSGVRLFRTRFESGEGRRHAFHFRELRQRRAHDPHQHRLRRHPHFARRRATPHPAFTAFASYAAQQASNNLEPPMGGRGTQALYWPRSAERRNLSEADKARVQALNSLATDYYHQGGCQKAVPIYQRVLEINPGNDRAHSEVKRCSSRRKIGGAA